MNWLESVVRMPASEALGWTVLHSLWQGILLSAVLGIVLASTRSPRARYVSASATLFALAAYFVVTLLHLLPPEHARLHAHSALVITPFSVNYGNQSETYHLRSVIPWLAPVWLMGVCLFYVRYAVAWLSTNRLRHRAACQAPACWQATLSRLAKEANISRPIALLESLFADTPMVLGHFRPVILTPLGFLAGLPTDHVEAVLLHELAHIARCDYMASMFHRLAEGLLFYHPAAWWMTHVIR